MLKISRRTITTLMVSLSFCIPPYCWGQTLAASGNVTLIATGDKEASNLTIKGSDVVGSNVNLIADNRVDLLASEDYFSQRFKENSNSGGIGVSAKLGKEKSVGFTGQAAVGRGMSNSDDWVHRNTHVTAKENLNLQSGGDTNLIGAVVKSNKVVGEIGGNLAIESLQDKSLFESVKQDISGSVTIDPWAGQYNGSVSGAQSKVDASFVGVNEQSGILAGNGGYQINVKGNTSLIGGAITSSQTAIEGKLNNLSTGTISVQDLDNESKFKAEAMSVSVSGGTGGGSGAAGYAEKHGKDTSKTQSVISGGLEIRDEAAQQEKTGNTAEETIAAIKTSTTEEVEGKPALCEIYGINDNNQKYTKRTVLKKKRSPQR